MKINEFINESTTAGSIATVAAPMTTQKRNNIGKGVYGNEKPGTLLTGKKTNKKYANSVNESKMKQVAMDLEHMQDGNFKQKYGKTKEQIKMSLGDPKGTKTVHEENISEVLDTHAGKMSYIKKNRTSTDNAIEKLYPSDYSVGDTNQTNVIRKRKSGMDTFVRNKIDSKGNFVKEADLQEDDLILIPGQGHKLKAGFHAFDPDKAEHEGETLKNSLRTIARNAKELHNRLENHDQFPEWVSEKIGQIKGMITSVTEYLISHQEGDAAPEHEGVIAGGGVGESLANWNMGVQSIPRTSEWKRKAITAIMPGAMGKEYTFDTEQEAIQHFTKAGWEKIKAGVPTKSGKPWEVIYADDVTEGKGLWANIHAKRERIKHGSGEHMRKPGSKGAPSAQDFKDAAKEGVGEKIKGAIRREKAKDLPLIQTRRDYASMQAGDAYEKGQTRKGNQYMAWAERDRKKKGDRTTNPAGTYRTKTSDYTNEGEDKQGDEYKAWRKKNFNDKKTTDKIVKGSDTRTKYDLDEAQSMGAALKNTLAKAEPGSKLDNSIKAHNRNIKAGQAGTLKNAPEGYHFDKKGYCRLGDK